MNYFSNKNIIILLFIFGLITSVNSGTYMNTQPQRIHQIKVHDINQVEMSISNYGTFGSSTSGDGTCAKCSTPGCR